MGEVWQVVDHLQLEYKGVFSVKDLFRFFTRWYKESAYEKGGDYVSEQHTSHGKCIEYVYWPWKKDSDYVRHFMKIRLLIYDLKKVDVMVDGKKKRLDHGKVLLYLDGFIEMDYEHRWAGTPILQFIRTLYIKYIYRMYTKHAEKIMVEDCHHLYDLFERFFNMYKTYKKTKEMPHFY
jgi:hypothetical protein